MSSNKKKKSLMKGYIGVKFKAVQLSKKNLKDALKLYPIFKRVCEKLKENNMTSANAGNMSIRHQQKGFFITSSGSNLGCLEDNEITYVENCNLRANQLIYKGQIPPSSETMMHYLIYKNRPQAKAIIHAHDEFATQPEMLEREVFETEKEEPYGTVELAEMAIKTFEKAKQIIVLKNHGYVAIGKDLDEACDIIVKKHLKLMEKSKKH